ncbi:hypothetical protein ES705_21918 [subsurface metagenome]
MKNDWGLSPIIFYFCLQHIYYAKNIKNVPVTKSPSRYYPNPYY